jgi:outer membrane lipoprotein-sorting protein
MQKTTTKKQEAKKYEQRRDQAIFHPQAAPNRSRALELKGTASLTHPVDHISIGDYVSRAMMPRTLAAVAAALLLALSAAPADAAPVAATSLSPQDQADLHRIEAYLDGLKTLTARFEQTSEDGAGAAGKVWLSRPGRMRFEYAPPQKLTIVSNGDYVAVDDQELKQVQFYPVESTPAWFLLREGIKLSGDVTVSGFERGPKTLRVTCVETKDPKSGSITLVFSDEPLTLRQWSVLDAQGRTTNVALTDAEPSGTIDAGLFKLPAQPNKSEEPGQER